MPPYTYPGVPAYISPPEKFKGTDRRCWQCGKFARRQASTIRCSNCNCEEYVGPPTTTAEVNYLRVLGSFEPYIDEGCIYR